MQRELSIYLDVVRFSAALAVFLGHASGVTGGLFWQFESLQYMYAAVIIFFVLSGYVIGFVANTKEHQLVDYLAARFARFYSVIIPALLVTFICAWVALNFNGMYEEKIAHLSTSQHLLRYVATLFNVQHFWMLDLTPGLNGPFWSLSYEFIYYAIFASCFYLTGKWRIIFTLLFSLLAGPTILFMLPMWLMGYYTFIFHQKYASVLQDKRWAAILSFLALVMLLVVSPLLKGKLDITIPLIRRWDVVGDYVDATSFTLHLMFIHALLEYIKRILFTFEAIIKWMAALTFALYLFHVPLITALPVLYFDKPAAWSSRLILYAGTLFVVATFGHWAENQKYPIKKKVKFFLNRLISSQ